MADDDFTFLDLACIMRIGPNTVLERFGSLINAGFFDASAVAGSLKQKGLVEFGNTYPGLNKLLLTPKAKTLIANANAKSNDKIDALDIEIIKQLGLGRKMHFEITDLLNVRESDLALRLYKLYKQGYVFYTFKNGNPEASLTENGFILTKKNEELTQMRMQTQNKESSNSAAKQANTPNRGPRPVDLLVIGLALLIIILFLLNKL